MPSCASPKASSCAGARTRRRPHALSSRGTSRFSSRRAVPLPHAVRPVQPDALVHVAGTRDDLALFVEYDRTRRVDKNYDKFRRYEALLAGWWKHALPAGLLVQGWLRVRAAGVPESREG